MLQSHPSKLTFLPRLVNYFHPEVEENRSFLEDTRKSFLSQG